MASARAAASVPASPRRTRQAATLVAALATWGIVYWQLAPAAAWVTNVLLGLSTRTPGGAAVAFFLKLHELRCLARREVVVHRGRRRPEVDVQRSVDAQDVTDALKDIIAERAGASPLPPVVG